MWQDWNVGRWQRFLNGVLLPGNGGTVQISKHGEFIKLLFWICKVLKLKSTPAIVFQRQWKLVHSFKLHCSWDLALALAKVKRMHAYLRSCAAWYQNVSQRCFISGCQLSTRPSKNDNRSVTPVLGTWGPGSSFATPNMLKIQGLSESSGSRRLLPRL